MAIKIKAKNKGKFTASAKKAGKSVQKHAHDVMNNPNSTALQRKRANFAIQAKKWKHENGGYGKYQEGGDQEWGNINTQPQFQYDGPTGPSSNTFLNQPPGTFEPVPQQQANTNRGVSAGQMSGYAAMAANALSGIIPSKEYAPQSTGSQVFGSIKQVGKQIPVVGGFVQAGDAMSGMFEKGIETSNKKGKSGIATGQAFLQGVVDPISEHQKIWDLQKKGKVSTGAAIGMSALNFLGGAGISNAILENKFKKDLHPELKQPYNAPKVTPINQLNPTTSLAMNGGQFPMFTHGGSNNLESYDTVSHRLMPNNHANAQLDGNPIQLEKKETIFRKKNGGDYVFSDNPELPNPFTGNTFAKDSKAIENKTKKPFYDPASEKSKMYQLKHLQGINDAERSKVEQMQLGGYLKAQNGANGLNLRPMGNPVFEQGFGYNENQPQFTAEPNNFAYNYQDNNVAPNLTNSPLVPYVQGQAPTTNNVGTSPTNQGSTNGRTNFFNNGNFAQIAGGLIPTAYSLARAFEKPDPVRLNADNTVLNQQVIAKDFNPMFLAQNAASRSINNSTTSDAVRRASQMQLTSNLQDQLGRYGLNVDNTNKQLAIQNQQQKSNQNQFNAKQKDYRDDFYARNKEATKGFGAKAAEYAGQTLMNLGQVQQADKNNAWKLKSLKNLSADYDINSSGDITYKGNVVDDNHLAYLNYSLNLGNGNLKIKRSVKNKKKNG